MALKPLHDTIFGDIIQHQPNEDLLADLRELTQAARKQFGDSRRFQTEAHFSGRQIEAAVEAKRNVHYQVMVSEVGPDCKDLKPGDIAILPPYGGTMLTVVDEDTMEYRRVFAIRESEVLALYRDD